MEVFIKNKSVKLNSTNSIGKGGEADVFDIGDNQVVKIYKQPDHPDLAGLDMEQEAARQRIQEHQKKLPAFPKNLPSRVIAPIDLATDHHGRVLGFTMPFLRGTEVLLRYSERTFRQKGVSNTQVAKIFKDLHKTVQAVHQVGVVLGDFNDLNILIADDNKAFLIDADSFQFGNYKCKVFTARFVDPLLCDPKLNSLLLVKPHNSLSDWYAYNIMLMQCLLFVGPYGGVFKPKDSKKRVQHDARPLHRITVFDEDVKYPKPAIRYDALPDEVLEHFHQVFQKDKRIPFPLHLLEMDWNLCGCGLEFARDNCPACNVPSTGAIKETTVIRGRVTCTRMFKTAGVILHATIQDKKLKWLYHENNTFRRENQDIVTKGALDPKMRFRLSQNSTLIAKEGKVVIFKPNDPLVQFTTDAYQHITVFDTNADHRYWIDNGRLLRDDAIVGTEPIGDVLSNQTLFWVGPEFGFGFYRAANLSVFFTFSADHKGINDTIKVPPIRGQLIDAYALFSKDKIWFFLATQESGQTKHRCYAIKPNGEIEGSAEAIHGDGSWLGHLRAKAAVNTWLFSATDDGIVRLEVDKKQIVVTKEFPDTEPFVDTQSELHVGAQGIYVIGKQEIKLLEIR